MGKAWPPCNYLSNTGVMHPDAKPPCNGNRCAMCERTSGAPSEPGSIAFPSGITVSSDTFVAARPIEGETPAPLDVERLTGLLQQSASVYAIRASNCRGNPGRPGDDYDAVQAADSLDADAGQLRALAARIPDLLRATAERDSLRMSLKDYDLLKRAVNEAADCTDRCDSHGHTDDCPTANSSPRMADMQREIESLRARVQRLTDDQRAYAMCVGADPDTGFANVTDTAIKLWQEMKGHQERAAAAESRLARLRQQAEALRDNERSGNLSWIAGYRAAIDAVLQLLTPQTPET